MTDEAAREQILATFNATKQTVLPTVSSKRAADAEAILAMFAGHPNKRGTATATKPKAKTSQKRTCDSKGEPIVRKWTGNCPYCGERAKHQSVEANGKMTITTGCCGKMEKHNA